MSKKARFSAHKANMENKLAQTLDDIAEFEEFRRDILPELRKAIKERKSAKAIYKMAEAAVAAKVVTVALTEKDNAKVLAASKEILDRGDGKATERKEITITNMSDEELDSLLTSTEELVVSDESTH